MNIEQLTETDREYITEDSVGNYQIMRGVSTKTWPLMRYLDDLIMKISERGVQQYVELDIVMRNSNNKIQAGVARSRHKESIGPIKLTPSHLTGPYILLAFGLLISIAAFVAELLLNRYNR